MCIPKHRNMVVDGADVFLEENACGVSLVPSLGCETIRHKQTTYPQDWSSYNRAQSNEFSLFQPLLWELLQYVKKEPRTSRGRPMQDIRDVLFACTLKAYFGRSGRRIVSVLEQSKNATYISSVPHYNTILKYLADPSLKPLLVGLVERSAIPMAVLEEDFATDSTGFSTSRFESWFSVKWGSFKGRARMYRKAHAMVGVRTGVITSVDVTNGHSGDSPKLIPLTQRTSERFEVHAVLADKAYSSRKNLSFIYAIGATPYIPFKKNTNGRAKGCPSWRRAWLYFLNHQQEFLDHYHQRSNVESAFSAIKRKFGHALYSRTDEGQDNEILFKCLCHNICILINAIYKFNIRTEFDTTPDKHDRPPKEKAVMPI